MKEINYSMKNEGIKKPEYVKLTVIRK